MKKASALQKNRSNLFPAAGKSTVAAFPARAAKPASIEVDLRQVVYALSDALDLVGVDDFFHGKRVAFIAVECGRLHGLDEPSLDTLLDAGLLHDCGVSSTQVHRNLVKELDWSGSHAHCERGYTLLRGFPPLEQLAPLVKHHHSHWDTLEKSGLDPRAALLANLIFLADRVDALAVPYYSQQTVLLASGEIRATIERHRGTLFCPQLVDTFLSLSSNESFWFSLEARHVMHYLADKASSRNIQALQLSQLKLLAQMFSRIVDAKSPYTAEHSRGVAKLARLLGAYAGLADEVCDKLEIAGLLHDIGKLRVPDEILDKPAPLSDEERAVIARHSFESYQILRCITGLEEIAAWAAAHHEMPDGSGYPFHYRGGQLPLEARILSVADVFQAMAQDRPYRRSLPAPAILGHLGELSGIGHLDPGVVALVEANLDACWQAATL